MPQIDYILQPIGFVSSILKNREEAPRQGNEGAPDCWLHLKAEFSEGLTGLTVGAEILVLCWFHLADRQTLKVHPRNNLQLSLTGVFATRSPDRPNPIGLHQVTILAIESEGQLLKLKVGSLEAVDGTPVLDIKPVLHHAPAD